MRKNLSDIGALLANRRRELELTQAEAGARIGVQKSMVSKIENGISVNVDTINRLADALGVDPVVELRPTARPSKDLIDYTMTAIIEFGRRHRLTIREASNYLNRFKGIDFISEFYDVEHTLSFNDCVDDLTIVCHNNGGALR